MLLLLSLLPEVALESIQPRLLPLSGNEVVLLPSAAQPGKVGRPS